MILSGTFHDAEPRQWRAAAADVADKVATTTDQFVDQTRRTGVRECIAILRGAQRFDNFPAADRQRAMAHVLAASVEKQARVSGCGRVTIPTGGAA